MLTGNGYKKLMALISMVDDPDEKVFHSLKNQVLSFEEDAVPVLEDAWMAATDLLVANRLEELLEEVNFRTVYNRIDEWLQKQEYDLTEAVFLINKFGIKDLDIKSYQSGLDHVLKDVWLEMNENLTALEKIKVLNHIFFEVHGFNSKQTNNEEVQHFFFSNLLNYKEGNPTSTGLLYLIAAQHLGLPVYGVNLPGHLILAYVDDRHKLKNNDGYTRNDVLFYINPYNGGAVFTDNEIELYIKQVKLKHKEHYFLPASNKLIIKRYLTELEKAYSRENKKVKSGYINKLKELFVEKE